ncbi:hypothetical protein OSB04_024861 [Centaurea solstitialis]|uniref:GAG-pre-integrase domain-containing protein n=1 Tax=Centaurea solstitialis TaxID=347529 RepID=A0AA38SNK9_9ASTR|nr:hypothetical protein OSB04_024861 [Centaurea solstitialis]
MFHLRSKAVELDACRHKIKNFETIFSEKDNQIKSLEHSYHEANAERISMSNQCENAKFSCSCFKTKFADLQKQLVIQLVNNTMEKDFFYEKELLFGQTFANLNYQINRLKRRVSLLEESDSWDSSTKSSPLIPDLRTTVPKLVLDPNIEYDVKVFLDADDPPSGYIPRKPVLPKAPAIKQISSTKPLASVFVINTEGKTCDGTDKGKSVKPHTPTVTQTQHSNTKDASSLVKPIKGLDFHSSSFDVDARTGDGTANVKPRRRRYRKKKNSFNAFPKWGGQDHTGLGYNPPSCNSNLNSKSVNTNRSANSDNLTAFKNQICSLFDNYIRVEDEDGNVILCARRNGHLYTTMFYAVPQHLEAVVLLAKETKEESWLWHQRLSHQNFRDMNRLVSKHLVNGLPESQLSKDTLCSACEKGKMKKSSHPP